jgi:branched-chain amino acid transport system substrate-binding protein
MKLSLSKLSFLILLAAAACAPDYRKTPAPRHVAGSTAPVVADQPNMPPKGVIPANVPTVKVALLVPLSGDSATIGNSMLDAATMALSDSYLTVPTDQIHAQVILLPKDTGNIPADSAKSVQQAIDQGANFIVGPLFSQSVSVVAPIAKAHNINLLTFSNNQAVAGNGSYLFGFLPEQQVSRMAEYAYLHNLQRVAVLAPHDSYGEKVKTALVAAYSQKGGTVAPAELYAPSPANIDAAVSRLAAAYNNATEDRRFQAIFIADSGSQLRDIISSLKKSKIDLKKVKLLGTGLWDDSEITKIPELNGAWFPSSPPDQYQVFEKRFMATYGYKPVRLASLAYDAVTLTATLAMNGGATGINPETLTSPAGYISPANGLFRLKPDGTSERKLVVMQVTPGGFKVIDPALKQF